MKQIQPISIWYNGQNIQANYIICTGQDNFKTSILVNYQLLDINENQLINGNLTMNGFDYEAYNTSPNGNDYVYNWAAQKLGVTLI